MRPTSFAAGRPNPPRRPGAQKHLERPSAQDIYEQVANNARQELGRSSISLAISGLAGGIFMGLSAMGIAIALALLTPAGTAPTAATLFIAKMFYPLGFIVVILGRSQLFTENTLYPVALVRRRTTSGTRCGCGRWCFPSMCWERWRLPRSPG